MINAFRISYALKNAYRTNGIIYTIKHIPLLKKILPDTLYKIRGFKIFANIVSALWELSSAFLGKLIYFYILSTGIAMMLGKAPESSVFLHIYFLLTIIGAYLNTFMFNPTNDKFYALILMRMDARAYTISNYIYSMLRVFIGGLPFVLWFGLKHQVSLWQCIVLAIFIVSIKLISAWLHLIRYQKTGNYTNENLPPKTTWIISAVLLAAAVVPPIFGFVIPGVIILPIMLLCIGVSFYAAMQIARFNDYRSMYQLLLASKRDAMDLDQIKQNAIADQNSKSITMDIGSTSRKEGFAYLNELFIKRHRKILWRPAKRMALIAAAVIAALLVAMYLQKDIADGINQLMMRRLPYFVFIMYMINRGTSFTQALFANCDACLLTYSFYKKPAFIFRLFQIRLWEIVKVNLLPASVIAIGLPLILYVSGGTPDSLDYFILPFSILLFSVFFSVHYLACYYLLQPYTVSIEMKSAVYQIVLFATYLACFGLMQAEINTLLFGIIAISACVVYCITACILVYKLAHKTFKLR